MFTRFLLAVISIALAASPVLAESQVACDESCPDGKVMTSYADGNNVTCICVEEASMEPTVADPEVPTGEDPNNTH